MDEPEGIVSNGNCPGRPRAQSCSVTSNRLSSASPKSRSRRTSTRRSERKSGHRTWKDGTSPHLSVPASPQSTRTRRLSPATVEAARLALAARAEYSKRRSSKCLEKAAFLIVTKDDEVKLDDLEMAALLNRSRRESGTQPGTPGSHRSFGGESTGGGSVSWNQAKRSPSATASISSASHESPKRSFGHGQATSGQGHLHKLRLSSFSSDAPSTAVPTSPMLRIFQGGSRSGSRVSAAGSSQCRRESSDDGSHRPPKNSPDPQDSFPDGGEKRSFGKASALKLAIAGIVMLTGTCAFVSASVLAKGEAWTIVGSSVMGVGSLLVLLGICWYLASTQDRVGDGGDPVEIKMVDQSQLAKLIKRGARVETVTVRV